MTQAFSDSWPFIRTCQECGHRQISKDPALYRTDSWRDIKCRKCKSESLDYGSKQPWTEEQKAQLDAYRKAQEEYD
jgi:hypothetical protein